MNSSVPTGFGTCAFALCSSDLTTSASVREPRQRDHWNRLEGRHVVRLRRDLVAVFPREIEVGQDHVWTGSNRAGDADRGDPTETAVEILLIPPDGEYGCRDFDAQDQASAFWSESVAIHTGSTGTVTVACKSLPG